MRIEPKQAFYNEDTGAVQPWKDIEVTDAVGNTLVAEGLVTEIEGGGGGGGGGVVIVTATAEDEAFVLNNTWNELRTLLNSGAIVMLQYSGENFTNNFLLVSCNHFAEAYEAIFLSANGNVNASCDTADGYPSYED